MEPYQQFDCVSLRLSGGEANVNPSASLGGEPSTKLVRGMSPIYINPIQGLIIEDAAAECGEGIATISITSEGVAIFTPSDGLSGPAVEVPAGSRKVLHGADANRALRVYRPSGLAFEGLAEFRLVDMLQGAFSLANVSDAERQAGSVRYRALFLEAMTDVTDVALWMTTDGQAAFALADEELDSLGTIQTIPNEWTAPTGLDWVEAISGHNALVLGAMSEGEVIGIWVRRTFPPAGVVAARELVNLHMSFQKLGGW